MNGEIKEIEKYLGVDSLEYLTIDEMLEAISEAIPENFCTACFSGNYPTVVDASFKKEIYEL
jgi:amidophosphoribosyltransferase